MIDAVHQTSNIHKSRIVFDEISCEGALGNVACTAS